MKLLAVAFAALAVGGPPKTLALQLVHTVSGCHVWQSASRSLGPNATVKLARGATLKIRVTCPMDFRVEQLSGPRLALGDPVFQTGTVRTIRFARKGTYVLRATNLQTSEEAGLQTLGPDNRPRLTVKVA